MAVLHVHDLDMTRKQVLNVSLHRRAAPPITPVQGQIYYDTIRRQVGYYDGGKWVYLGQRGFEVRADAGLTGTVVDNEYRLSVNVDNFSVEIANDILRLKDGGVTEPKLADASVTTSKLVDASVTNIKLADKSITFSKIQDIPFMTVIGRVTTGTGVPAAVPILSENDFASNSSTSLATQSSIKAYVDSRATTVGRLIDGFDAAAASQLPFATGGTRKGDYWYITKSGILFGQQFVVSGLVIAKEDAPDRNDISDWIVVGSAYGQATTTQLGLVRLAIEAEVNAGTDTQKAITPYTLSLRTATTSRTGLIELATQAEVDLGLDDKKAVTPATLKSFTGGDPGGGTSLRIARVRFRVGVSGAPINAGSTTFVLRDCNGEPILDRTVIVYRAGELVDEGDTENGFTYNPETGDMTVAPATSFKEKFVIMAYPKGVFVSCEVPAENGHLVYDDAYSSEYL